MRENETLQQVPLEAAPIAAKQPAVKMPENPTPTDHADNPALSNRVEQHLINNLRL